MVKIDLSEIPSLAGNIDSISQTASDLISKEKTHELVASFQKMCNSLEGFQEFNKQAAITAAEVLVNQNFSNLINHTNKLYSNSFKELTKTLQTIDFAAISSIQSSADVFKQVAPNLLKSVAKCDFRISVLEQEIEKDLSILDQEEITEPNDETTNFYEKIHSELATQKKQTNDQTEKLDEMKLMIVSMAEKIGNLEDKSRNNELDKNQSDKTAHQALKKKINGFILAFFFVCEFVEHSETAYQLFIWLQKIISNLITLLNISS